MVCVVHVCERVTLKERESGRDASWKMTAFNKYVGGKTLYYTEKRGKNGVSLGMGTVVTI